MTSKTKIKGGCVLLARQLLNSDIWFKPPEYLKIFIYILLNVNHADTSLFPKGSNFFNFSLHPIKGVSQNQIYEFLRWAVNSGVLTKQKTKRGVVLKLNNYSYFQLLKNYKFQNTFQDNSRTINKNVKNDITRSIPNSEEYKLSHEVIREKDCKMQSEREFFSFSREDYEILKVFAKKYSKNNFWGYLRALEKDIEGAQAIVAEEKRRQKILKSQETEKETPEDVSILEFEIEKIEDKKEAMKYIITRQNNLKLALLIPQYKKLASKFQITLQDLERCKNDRKTN